MKFSIFAMILTLLLSFLKSEGILENKKFVVGIKNLDLVRSELPKDEWYETEHSNYAHCNRLLKSMWIFPENYSDTSEKPPFGMIHKQYEAFNTGTLILYYDNNPKIIPAFCCQHDENMAIYIAYNKSYENSFIAFRKTSIHRTMTPGIPYVIAASYEKSVSIIFNLFYYGYEYISSLDEAIDPTFYCLSFFWKLSRYEMEGYEALTIISEIELSSYRLQCQSFLFAEVQNGYFLSYDIRVYIGSDSATDEYKLILKGNDRVDLVTLGHIEP